MARVRLYVTLPFAGRRELLNVAERESICNFCKRRKAGLFADNLCSVNQLESSKNNTWPYKAKRGLFVDNLCVSEPIRKLKSR